MSKNTTELFNNTNPISELIDFPEGGEILKSICDERGTASPFLLEEDIDRVANSQERNPSKATWLAEKIRIEQYKMLADSLNDYVVENHIIRLPIAGVEIFDVRGARKFIDALVEAEVQKGADLVQAHKFYENMSQDTLIGIGVTADGAHCFFEEMRYGYERRLAKAGHSEYKTDVVLDKISVYPLTWGRAWQESPFKVPDSLRKSKSVNTAE